VAVNGISTPSDGFLLTYLTGEKGDPESEMQYVMRHTIDLK